MGTKGGKLTRIVVRGFMDGVKQFEELHELGHDDEEAISALAFDNVQRVGGPDSLHIIEIEFLDEPDINQRFFRIGTDPSLMVIPLIRVFRDVI